MNPITKQYQRQRDQKPPIAKETTIQQNLSLVRRVAYRIAAHLPSSVEIEDLISAGCVGLLMALERYDSEVGLDFATFAEYRIKGAILDNLRTLDPLPRRSRKWLQDLERARKKLTGTLGRPPADDELADELGLAHEVYEEMFAKFSPCMGLSFVLLDGVSAAQRASEASSSPSPFDVLERRQLRGALVRAIRALPERERTVISLYYYAGLSYKEIALLFDVTDSRISQIHRLAAQRIKAGIEADWNETATPSGSRGRLPLPALAAEVP